MEDVNVYVRNEEIEEDEYDDIWDDELLIKAYNKSVKNVKEKIAQRILLNGPLEDCKNKGIEKTSRIKETSNCGLKNRRNSKWKVGDYCRAVYSDDGLEYEAQIIGISSDGQCIIKYSGYDNEEIVKLKDLKQSLGGNARAAQKHASCSRPENNSSHQVAESYDFNAGNATLPPIPGIPAVPPPPALSLTSRIHQENESDALSAMLMSWYMSGYHTGFYQGLVQAKNQNQKSSNSKKC